MLFATSTPTRPIAELAQLQVFGGCTAREVRRIDRLVTRVDVAAGRVLCRQGEPGRECFIVVSGRANVTVDGHCVGAIERGQVIGEIALVASNGRRTATVVAQTHMTLLVLTPVEFADLLATIPSVAHSVLRETTRRLVENSEVDPTAPAR